MIRLCLSEIDNDASVALFDGTRLVHAVSEERISRKKQHQGFPHLAIRQSLDAAGATLNDVDQLCIAKPEPADEIPAIYGRLRHYSSGGPHMKAFDALLDAVIIRGWKRHTTVRLIRRLHREIEQWLEDNRFPRNRVKRAYNHHFLHVASAYYGSGFTDALAITADGQGGGVTASVYDCRSGRFTNAVEVLYPNSMGLFYAAATKALGYIPNRHEGKLTGLASFATPPEECLRFCRSLAAAQGATFTAHGLYGTYPRLLRLVKRYSPAEIAAAWQLVLEEVLRDFAAWHVKRSGLSRVVLAGGVFANVKLNQRIREIPGVDEVFVFPAMADSGLAWGAGAWEARRETEFQSIAIQDVYWGPSWSDDDIVAAFRRSNVSFETLDDVATTVGDALADDHLVWRFDGAMEFGPRALGNRSILYHSRDRSVNDWLNATLKRTEFMPFAPVTLVEHADECYQDLDSGRRTAYFMTMTFDCTDRMKEWSPAAVHVDGTARPQLIDKAINPDYYGIVRRYYERTGIPSVINTSFNMHEEPIVCSPDDAVRAWLTARMGILSMGRFLARAFDTPNRSKRLKAEG